MHGPPYAPYTDLWQCHASYNVQMHVQKIVKKNRTCKQGFKRLAAAKTDKIILFKADYRQENSHV